jgi:hypothetical protein
MRMRVWIASILSLITLFCVNGEDTCDIHSAEFGGCDEIQLQAALDQATIVEDGVLLGDLIRHGVDLQAQGHRGQTPLILAATAGIVSNVAKLLEQEVDLERRDLQGFTALVAAAQSNKTEVVKLLVSSGAVVDAKAEGGAGVSALMAAAYMNNGAVLQLLLDNTAAVNLPDNHGATAIDYAMNQNNTAAFKKLEDAGGVSGTVAPAFDFIADLMLQPFAVQFTLFVCTFFAFCATFYACIKSWTTAKYRKILHEFYGVHCPEKIPHIETILYAYSGREDLMMQKIREKYLENLEKFIEKDGQGKQD